MKAFLHSPAGVSLALVDSAPREAAMKIDRRHFIVAIGGGLLSLSGRPKAQPRVPMLRVLCGYPPGGSTDIVSRRIADKLAGGRYATAAFVDSKSGAAGRIAMQELKHAAADGSVLLITPASIVTMYPHVFRNPGYDVFADTMPV